MSAKKPTPDGGYGWVVLVASFVIIDLMKFSLKKGFLFFCTYSSLSASCSMVSCTRLV